ncbi:MAG: O-antigen ligase family protein [Oscillospiraceae bacterium]|nr:O-antigen ligase family protein [Oscillospiraceae bacterium]
MNGMAYARGSMMMKKNKTEQSGNDFILFVYILWGLWYVFFTSSLVLRPYYNILWPLLAIGGLLLAINKVRHEIRRNSVTFFWIVLFFVTCLISALFSNDRTESLDYIQRMLLGVMFALVIASCSNKKLFLQGCRIYSLILLGVSFLQYFLPSFYINSILPLISQNRSTLVLGAINVGYSVGLTNGTSINGCFMAIGFCLYWAKAVTSKKNKIINLLIAALFFGMTFATGKRSYSLILIVLFVLSVGFVDDSRNFVKRTLKILGIVFLAFALFYLASLQIPSLNNIMNKFIYYIGQGDISNGRFELYVDALTAFKEHPLFGIGVNASGAVLGGAVHNSYLQWLVEFGIIGIIIPAVFVFRIIVKYAFQLPALWRVDDNINEKEVVLFSLLYCILFLLAGLFATPFQWTNNFMLFVICEFFIMDYCKDQNSNLYREGTTV